MQVLHLISSSGFYGADNTIIELSRQILHTTFSPIIGVFNNLHNPRLELAVEARRHNFPVEIFPCNGKIDFRTILSIRQFLTKQQVNIIHSHGYKSNIYALAASAGKTVSRIATCHNWLGDDSKMKFYAHLDKSLLNLFDRVVAVSNTVKHEILAHNISPAKVSTIFNGTHIERFDKQETYSVRKEFGIDTTYKVVGTVGRLSEEKGHINLIHAAKKVVKEFPNVVFLIVGDGPLRQDLQDKVSKLGEGESNGNRQSPFIFTGVRSDMPAIYALMDIFVLPSFTEGLPMVLLEAMAGRKPVVATRVGAVPQVIEDNHSGLLIPPADVESLSNAIMHLLKDPQKAQYLAQNGYKRVRDHFSAKRMAEQYVEVYKDVLSARSNKG